MLTEKMRRQGYIGVGFGKKKKNNFWIHWKMLHHLSRSLEPFRLDGHLLCVSLLADMALSGAHVSVHDVRGHLCVL